MRPPRLAAITLTCVKSAIRFCILGAVTLTIPFALHAESFRVGVVPQFSITAINATWSPLLEALADRTGHEFELIIEKDITLFEVAFERGDYDLAYMNPWHAAIAHEKQGYRLATSAHLSTTE